MGYLESPEQGGHQLIDLPSADIAPQTHVVSCTEMQHGPLHSANLFLAGLGPALGAENLDVVAEGLLIAPDSPGADANDGTGREVLSTDLGAAGGDDALEDEARGRVHAEVLLDAGVHVGKVLLREVEVYVAGQGGQVPRGQVVCEFLLEFGVDGGIFEDVVEECGQGYGAERSHVSLHQSHNFWEVWMEGGSDVVSAPARIMVKLKLRTSLSVIAFGWVCLALRNLSSRSSRLLSLSSRVR